MGEIIDLEEVSLPFVSEISVQNTILQIPEGCKQRFKAAEFQGRYSASAVVTRLNKQLGYEAFIVSSIPGTHCTEYYVGHVPEKRDEAVPSGTVR